MAQALMDVSSAERVIDSAVCLTYFGPLVVVISQGDYIGESISQLEHCLQAAHCARSSGSSDEVVLAALLHDCGQILPIETLKAAVSSSSDVQDMRLFSGISVGRHGHEYIGAQYLEALGFPLTICELVRDHVIAKRYLTAVEEGYYANLSDASKKSLEFQGGPFSPTEVTEFEHDPLFKEKVMMRRFDDNAKEVDKWVPRLESYRDLAVIILSPAKV
uniref:HD domain-containing protein n=1 Tax=Moniliophthora roreri TaxID=221103 RepID=A0A0W0EU81_MONRR